MAKLSNAKRVALEGIENGGFIIYNSRYGTVWGPSGRIRLGTFNALSLDCLITKHSENGDDKKYILSEGGQAALEGRRALGKEQP